MKNSVKTIAGIAAAAAVGAALGIAYAPAKGSETRKKIKGTIGDAAGSLKSSANKMKSQVVDKSIDLYEKGKNGLNQIADKTQAEAKKIGIV
ncbi:YtxH domain-containing protein [Lacihabitans sp. LS3-19]|uniref:YtxH domain-containing protein n=1 Tax=Lacihabitans sp. LS3-19 TaxID=2487335 RepID=UPI0020CE2463|nr:YtxH domain-containing protein [Lacihabitans sp. LS3-19]MCP9768932.1 YtxH domain-containing protein [Lacihabitans sp. LS3-19]